MRVTEKDKLIYNYICKYKFATVKQIANVFFNDIIYKNELAKKRLNCLLEHHLIKSTKSTNCAQHIFYVDSKYKSQTYHNIIIMDFLSKLQEMSSVDVVNFEREKVWTNSNNTTIRSDGLFKIHYNGYARIFLLEVRTSSNSFKKSIEKYNAYKNEITKECGCKPVLILVDSVKHDLSDVSSFMPIIQIDQKLTDFPLIFDI